MKLNLFEVSRICYSLVVRLGTKRRRPAIDSPIATIPLAGAITIPGTMIIPGTMRITITIPGPAIDSPLAKVPSIMRITIPGQPG